MNYRKSFVSDNFSKLEILKNQNFETFYLENHERQFSFREDIENVTYSLVEIRRSPAILEKSHIKEKYFLNLKCRLQI